MSFSAVVKEELRSIVGAPRHCQLSEIAAILSFEGELVDTVEGEACLRVQTENYLLARKYFTLLRKTFNIYTIVRVRKNSIKQKTLSYILEITEKKDILRVLQGIKSIQTQEIMFQKNVPVNEMLLKNHCCIRSFLRGAFLCVGSMSDPEKGYHLEFVANNLEQAKQLERMIQEFSLEAKTVQRKKYYVVYLKEGSQIVDLLNVMEAHVALMELENTRIVKEVRNSVNRRVNCETANISKTVLASSKQVEDIRYIAKAYGLGNLGVNLAEIAELRLDNPEATLKELGEMMSPPVGKSGVNHRLRKLSELADRLRMQ